MKVTFDQLGGEGATREDAAVVFVISDALGDAAQSVVISAASQFSDGAVRIVRLSQIKSVDEVRDYFDSHDEDFVSTAVFHSVVDPVLRRLVKAVLNERGITSVDILGPVVQILAGLTGETPKNIASAHHRVDSRYLRRVAAMEYFVDHDNGKNPQDLGEADVVLVGLTGSAKSPLAMHLSFLGYKVASVSLDPGCTVPEELAKVDPNRVFGLEATTDVLATARVRDAKGQQRHEVLAEIEAAQEGARREMDRLGCERLSADNKTFEELASDIIFKVEGE